MTGRDAIRDSINENLSGLHVSQRQHDEMLSEIIGGTKVKKKLSVGLALAMALILLTVTAFAAYMLTRSPQADATSRARQALTVKYGLTMESLGCFVSYAEQKDDVWTVTFVGDGFYPGLLGSYIVVIDDSGVSATWSHDDVDRALWENGDLTAPVWGQPQIEKALRDPAAADAIEEPLYARDPDPIPVPTPDVSDEVLKQEGVAWWNGEIIRAAEPGEGDISREKAIGIAYQALREDFGLSDEDMAKLELVEADFKVRENGGTLWGVSVYLIREGVEWGGGVTLDGKTGEVLNSNIMTGGNG